jgi:hypothetical protein
VNLLPFVMGRVDALAGATQLSPVSERSEGDPPFP